MSLADKIANLKSLGLQSSATTFKIDGCDESFKLLDWVDSAAEWLEDLDLLVGEYDIESLIETAKGYKWSPVKKSKASASTMAAAQPFFKTGNLDDLGPVVEALKTEKWEG